ncbi:hybrid sensor histidine kinase/response regulator [Allofranklinella schreckenbergeri]|uniref:Chemotaxis protein CheA n=2 Tax=Allofranklinella schreckenbergeri TaxID=1076744 RepID=A0A3M6Q8X6_9BURK|nr:hybrid sensor histidine kinase/response regulator [Allofranklinella schreckenbergeri]
MVERSQQLASTGEHIKADASFGQFLAQLAQHIQQLSNQPAAQPEQVRRVITDSLQEIQSALDGIVASTGYGQVGRNEFDRLATLQAALPSASQPPAPSAETLAIMGQIDPDLFPIFEEEAIELLPRLIGGLRRWASEPQSFEARSEVLRVLHTLKGSSRLAGARQIGEMAHRFESDIEALEAKADNAQHIPPLFARYDELQSAFDALRSAATEVESSLASAEGPATQFDLAEAAAQAEATGSEQATPHTPASAAPTPASATPGPSSSGASLPHTPQIGASFGTDLPGPTPLVVQQSSRRIQTVRVRSTHINRLINQAGEIQISRSRAESRLRQLNTALDGMTVDLDRLRHQLRELEVQTESQMQSRMTLGKDSADFDPLELDRFTRVQELTRMMAETVNDVATVQRTLQAAMIGTEDDLVAQERKGRELQRDLLHTRMVEFDSVAERLHAVVRQAATDTGKMADLVIENGNIEMDRVLLDRLMGGFEHLLRNCVGHGIEPPAEREQAGKPATGIITLTVEQEGNDVAISFSDDGAGLNLEAIRNKGIERGLITADQEVTTKDLSNLIFMPGFTTAQELTGVSGRGIGMDVVRVDVSSLGGRIETTTEKGKGTTFRMVMPLTTAVTQVMLVRAGTLIVGLPANLIDGIERVSHDVLLGAYDSGVVEMEGKRIPFYWAGAMLQHSQRSQELAARTYPVVLVRSAAQIVAVHVDEVLGNQEVVVKNLGPQLSTLPGLTGMSVLASGAVLLVYNFIALASVYGASAQALQRQRDPADIPADIKLSGVTRDSDIPLVMVVDDSITVRRVTERMLKREGYRVVLAANGAVALEMLQQAQELPVVILSDIEMPQMDGFELLTHVRADARLASLPVVMITSRMAQKHRDHAMQLGANHYLGKPYSDAELLALVRQYANAVQAEA